MYRKIDRKINRFLVIFRKYLRDKMGIRGIYLWLGVCYRKVEDEHYMVVLRGTESL